MNNILPELLYEITTYLSTTELYNFMSVCKKWKNIFELNDITKYNLKKRKEDSETCCVATVRFLVPSQDLKIKDFEASYISVDNYHYNQNLIYNKNNKYVYLNKNKIFDVKDIPDNKYIDYIALNDIRIVYNGKKYLVLGTAEDYKQFTKRKYFVETQYKESTFNKNSINGYPTFKFESFHLEGMIICKSEEGFKVDLPRTYVVDIFY